jgi:dTDP-4-dehydrorhamnose reductase
MKILLIGKNGQVGFELRRSLSILGDVVAVGSRECDLRDETNIRKNVRLCQPDIIVNAGAYTNVDGAEVDGISAELINSVAPGILADEARRCGAVIVHYSTDYVFDGEKVDAYVEDDLTQPLNVYGKTKLAGEAAVKSNCDRYLILRTSWVVASHGKNFAKSILRLAAERDVLNIVCDQVGAPTSASTIADITTTILREWSQSPSCFPYGIYHLTAGGLTSWYEYAKYVVYRAKEAGLALRMCEDDIRAISSSEYKCAARRPKNSELSNEKLKNQFRLILPQWQVSLDHVLDQIIACHKIR